MILRRPYAFFIKHFKLIHVFLFLFFIYSIFAFRNIYHFLVNYVKNGSFIYQSDIANKYVPIIFLIIFFVMIALEISIYLLLKRKEKPTLFYLILIIYSVISFGVMIFFRSFYVSLRLTVYDILNIIIYRDIAAAIYFLCYPVIGFLFIRTFGFDIKKFRFEQDKRELNIDASDNEEIELNISVDKYDAAKIIRQQKREMLYYVKENALFFKIIGILLLICAVGFVYFYFFVSNKVYSMDSTISLGNFDFQVSNVYTTREDRYQKVVISDGYFLVVNLKINNKSKSSYTLDREYFRVNINDQYYYVSETNCDTFADIGNCYKIDKKIVNGMQEFVLIFKIKEEKFSGYFEILKNKRNGYTYEKMKINVDKIVKDVKEYEMDNDYFKIDSYETNNSAAIKTQECVEDNCKENTKNIYAEINKELLILSVSNIDNSFTKEFLDDYLGAYYYIGDKKYEITSDNVDVLEIADDKVYLSVPKLFVSHENRGIFFKTRTEAIYIKLVVENE